jgi:hypothetical protein
LPEFFLNPNYVAPMPKEEY